MDESLITIDNIAKSLTNLQHDNTNDVYGLVDMGSNGIRFSISDLRPPSTRLLTPIYHERAAISLYDALHDSKSDKKEFYFSDHVITNVAETIGRFRKICMAHGIPEAQFVIFATEALRTAKNQDRMLEAIQNVTGFPVKILSHEVETLFGAMGARSGFKDLNSLFMDLGGGSIQVTYVNTSMGPNYETLAAKAGHSLPFGAAKLMAEMSNPKTAQIALAELQNRMNATVQHLKKSFIELRRQIDSTDGVTIYFSGGGFRGYGSMLMHTDPIQPYPIPAIGGYSVPGSRFEKWQEMLIANQQKEEIFGLSKRRRHQFPAIAMVVQAIVLAIPRIKSVVFCTGGNREGLLFMKLPPNIREMDPFPLIPTPNPDQDPQIIHYVTNLLTTAFPKVHIIPPSIFKPEILSFIARHIWAYQGLKGNASRAIQTCISELRTALPSISHPLCAVLALTISARWGFDLGPVDSQIAKNLQRMVGNELIWWCRYIGTICHFLSILFPVFPSDLESFRKALYWHSSASNSLGKKSNKEGIELRVYILPDLVQGIPGGLEGHLLKMWKKFGKGLGLSRKLQVDIKLMS